MRFEDVFGTTLITLSGDVDEAMLRVFDRVLKDVFAAPQLENRATIFLTTYGGASGYAMALYERLRLAQRTFDLRIVGIGVVYSHGASVMMALPPERRFLTAGTRVLLHELQKDIELSMKGPHASRQQILEQEMRTFEEERATLDWMLKILQDGTGRDRAELRQLISHGHFMSAAEAVEFGIAGSLLDEQ